MEECQRNTLQRSDYSYRWVIVIINHSIMRGCRSASERKNEESRIP